MTARNFTALAVCLLLLSACPSGGGGGKGKDNKQKNGQKKDDKGKDGNKDNGKGGNNGGNGGAGTGGGSASSGGSGSRGGATSAFTSGGESGGAARALARIERDLNESRRFAGAHRSDTETVPVSHEATRTEGLRGRGGVPLTAEQRAQVLRATTLREQLIREGTLDENGNLTERGLADLREGATSVELRKRLAALMSAAEMLDSPDSLAGDTLAQTIEGVDRGSVTTGTAPPPVITEPDGHRPAPSS